MISALLDTNILLDSMLAARPQHKQAKCLIKLAADGRYAALVSAGSLKDIYYVTRKYVNDETARGFIRLFMQMLDVRPVDKIACQTAVDSDEPDFEDGIIRSIAEAEHADFIITRDELAYQTAHIKKIDATAFLEIIEMGLYPA